MFPSLRQIKTVDDYQAVMDAAKDDNHVINWPTHMVEKEGKIVGAASIASVPLLLVWNHSTEVKIRDSLHLNSVYRAIMEAKGHSEYLIACDADSPYNKYMEIAGYKPFWKTELFYAKL